MFNDAANWQVYVQSRSRGPTSGSVATRLLGLRVRTSTGPWISLCLECCVMSEFSMTGWSLVQRSPTECGVSECDCEATIMRWSWTTKGRCAMGGGIYNIRNTLPKSGIFLLGHPVYNVGIRWIKCLCSTSGVIVTGESLSSRRKTHPCVFANHKSDT